MARDVWYGTLLSTVPGMALMLGGWWLEWLFVERYNPRLNLGAFLNITVAALALVAPFVLAWLWWSIVIPRWRVWALRRNRDWPMLERLAIKANLIWDERTVRGRFFAKTELWTAGLRREFADLRRLGDSEQ